jgi:hypothetical protein
MRISANAGVAEFVVTVIADPVVVLVGAVSMAGRILGVPSGLNRYGGE